MNKLFHDVNIKQSCSIKRGNMREKEEDCSGQNVFYSGMTCVNILLTAKMGCCGDVYGTKNDFK